jgi:hypothetical protein
MTSDAQELQWHRTVVLFSALTPAVVAGLNEGNPLRIFIGSVFVLLVPGMAVVGRSSYLLRSGLWSVETWSTVIPISFAVFVAASLGCVYVYGWRPTVTITVISLVCLLSSALILRQRSSRRDR